MPLGAARWPICLALLLASMTAPARVGAAPPSVAAEPDPVEEPEPADFGHLDFEELRRIKVVTASRTEEGLFGLPAAAHVITAVDIRRSGARTLPDVLRLAPGVEVGRINSRSFSVTVRGFNGTAANKILPLIDGRSIYSQRFSGTIWDARDVMLEDVDRIEVIRGPGGTAWGANAVNGVINVLTKDARETQGTLVSLGGGSLLRGFASVRHGFSVGERSWMRVFARGFARGETSRLDGGDPNDSWSFARGGFRMDVDRTDRTHWTVMGDVFSSEADQILPPALLSTALTSGGALQVRGRVEGETGGVTLIHTYLDGLHRNSGGLRSHSNVVEADVQHEVRPGGRHRLTGGLNYRFSRLEDFSDTFGSVLSTYDPTLRYLNQAGVFVEDRVEIAPGRFAATLGCKLEYDDFTGMSPLPSLRLAWTPTATQTVWGAVSRATRIPSRGENDQTTVTPGPFVSEPNPELEPESVVAWEVGWRMRPVERVSVDVSGHYSAYEDLFASVMSSSPTLMSSRIENAMHGEAWGGAGEVTWQPAPWWQLRGSLSYVEIALRRTNPAVPSSAEAAEWLSPAQQASVRSSWTLGKGAEADVWLRRVGELPSRTSRVPPYTALDARLAWEPRDGVRLSLAGQNLLDPLHEEFRFFTTRWEIPRAVTGEVTLQF